MASRGRCYLHIMGCRPQAAEETIMLDDVDKELRSIFIIILYIYVILNT